MKATTYAEHVQDGHNVVTVTTVRQSFWMRLIGAKPVTTVRRWFQPPGNAFHWYDENGIRADTNEGVHIYGYWERARFGFSERLGDPVRCKVPPSLDVHSEHFEPRPKR